MAKYIIENSPMDNGDFLVYEASEQGIKKTLLYRVPIDCQEQERVLLNKNGEVVASIYELERKTFSFTMSWSLYIRDVYLGVMKKVVFSKMPKFKYDFCERIVTADRDVKTGQYVFQVSDKERLVGRFTRNVYVGMVSYTIECGEKDHVFAILSFLCVELALYNQYY